MDKATARGKKKTGRVLVDVGHSQEHGPVSSQYEAKV